MRRRDFIALLGGAPLALSLTAPALPADRIRRIGVLMPLSRGDRIAQRVMDAFVQSLQKLGWSEGKTFLLETRYSDGKPERLPALAAELVQANIDVLMAWAAQAVDAARQATTSIPIVITGVGDALTDIDNDLGPAFLGTEPVSQALKTAQGDADYVLRTT